MKLFVEKTKTTNVFVDAEGKEHDNKFDAAISSYHHEMEKIFNKATRDDSILIWNAIQLISEHIETINDLTSEYNKVMGEEEISDDLEPQDLGV